MRPLYSCTRSMLKQKPEPHVRSRLPSLPASPPRKRRVSCFLGSKTKTPFWAFLFCRATEEDRDLRTVGLLGELGDLGFGGLGGFSSGGVSSSMPIVMMPVISFPT